MESNKKHTLQIELGQGFIATFVVDVLTFNERQIVVRLATAEKVHVLGENLKINAFNKQSGELRVVGVVQNVKYIPSVKQRVKRFLG